jgi:hypothetical protein
MAFGKSHLTSRPAPRRTKDSPVFCVGWRAFVHWPVRAAQTAGPVPLTDVNGRPLANDLVDGQPVEILSWRPRSRDGVLYQIRSLADGSEWWIGAQHLRRQAVAEVPVAVEPVADPAQR